MKYTVEELRIEFEVFKKMAIDKVKANELNAECLERIIHQIYSIGITQGQKEKEKMNKYEQQITKLVIAMLDNNYTYDEIQKTFNDLIGTIWINWCIENTDCEDVQYDSN
jgi:hypothetical protein